MLYHVDPDNLGNLMIAMKIARNTRNTYYYCIEMTKCEISSV